MNNGARIAFLLCLYTTAGLCIANDVHPFFYDVFSSFIKAPELPCDLLRSLYIAHYYVSMNQNNDDPIMHDALLGRLSRCVWCLRNGFFIVPNNSDIKERLHSVVTTIVQRSYDMYQKQPSLLHSLLSDIQQALHK